MKRLIPLLLTLCLLLPVLLGCNTEKPTYTKHLPAKTEDISWEDRMTEDAITVSSVLSYSKEEIERPGGLRLVTMQKYTYSAADGLYIPIKRETNGQYAYHTTIYHYDTDGKLTEEIVVPYETEHIELFRVLSDKRFLLLQTNPQFGFSKVSLLMIDANGTVLFESPKFSFSESVQSYIDSNEHGIYVTNREDGSLRILVNAIDRVYYFDESLTLLSEVILPAESTGITPLDDDVYMIGSEMPSVCKVDLKNGTAEFADVPVLPEMKYYSTFFCGGDGKLYCSYKDSIYLCQKDDTGRDSLIQLMNWYQGSFNGQGFYWIVNDTCMFFVPISVQHSSMVVYVLKLGSSPDTLNRRVLTFVALTDSNTVQGWYLDAISLFNERSKDYYIHYIYLNGNEFTGKFIEDRLDAYLLSGNKPDMVLFPSYRKYAEKNLLLDLSADYADRLIAPVRDAYTDENGAIYALPLFMQMYTYACKSSLLDGPLTWDDMYALGEELKASDPGERMALSTVVNEVESIYYLLQNYVDYETKTSSFHSDDFHQKVRFKEEMKPYVIEDYGTFYNDTWYTGDRYGVLGNTEIISALDDGRVKLSYFPFLSISGYASLKMFFGDIPFSLCGYPSDDENRYFTETQSVGLLSVFADSPNLDGCKEFLDFLLSDEIQTSSILTKYQLPVTRSALEQLIDENRYYYFSKTPSSVSGMDPTLNTLLLEPMMTSKTYDEDAASRYIVIEITDEDKERILSFFDNSTSCPYPDTIILRIVNEELSVYRAGARSLEETTKIIDSRVWIYLNE